MKLVMTIISNKDAHALVDELMKKGYRSTKLASTGGFLREGNTTLLTVVSAQEVERVVELIEATCHSRQEVMAPFPPMPGSAESFFSIPLEVTVGGATIFVVNVEKSYKV